MIEKRADSRGTATRERLIASALELFGTRGYEGVGAREIAAAAGVPLSAIPYHFGTKEALYRASLECVRTQLAAALAPAAAAAAAALRGPAQDAMPALATFQGALLDVLAATPEAENWAKLLLREHLDPSPAFDLVYEDAGRGAIELIAALIGRASERNPDAPDVLIEAFARMGQVLMFRLTRYATARRLGWESLGKAEGSPDPPRDGMGRARLPSGITMRGRSGWTDSPSGMIPPISTPERAIAARPSVMPFNNTTYRSQSLATAAKEIERGPD